MKSVILLVASLLAVIAAPAQAYAPADVCFTKSQKCCYKFKACDVVRKKVKLAPRCDFDKCKKVCKPECTEVKATVPKKRCVDKKVFSHNQCEKVCRNAHGHYYYGKPECQDICTPQFENKRVCSTKHVEVAKKVCKKECKKVCARVKAICPKTQVFEFAKFCPELKCEDFRFSGEHKEPAVVVSKESKLVKVVPGPRKIIEH